MLEQLLLYCSPEIRQPRRDFKFLIWENKIQRGQIMKKRRRHSAEIKTKTVLEALKEDKSIHSGVLS